MSNERDSTKPPPSLKALPPLPGRGSGSSAANQRDGAAANSTGSHKSSVAPALETSAGAAAAAAATAATAARVSSPKSATVPISKLNDDAKQLCSIHREADAETVLKDAVQLGELIYEQFNEHDPDMVGSLIQLAKLSERRGRTQAADAYLAQASVLLSSQAFPLELQQPLEWDLNYEKALLLLARGSFDQARDLLQDNVQQRQAVIEDSEQRHQLFRELRARSRSSWYVSGFSRTHIPGIPKQEPQKASLLPDHHHHHHHRKSRGDDRAGAAARAAQQQLLSDDRTFLGTKSTAAKKKGSSSSGDDSPREKRARTESGGARRVNDDDEKPQGSGRSRGEARGGRSHSRGRSGGRDRRREGADLSDRRSYSRSRLSARARGNSRSRSSSRGRGNRDASENENRYRSRSRRRSSRSPNRSAYDSGRQRSYSSGRSPGRGYSRRGSRSRSSSRDRPTRPRSRSPRDSYRRSDRSRSRNRSRSRSRSYQRSSSRRSYSQSRGDARGREGRSRSQSLSSERSRGAHQQHQQQPQHHHQHGGRDQNGSVVRATNRDEFGSMEWVEGNKFGQSRCRDGMKCVRADCGFAHPIRWTLHKQAVSLPLEVEATTTAAVDMTQGTVAAPSGAAVAGRVDRWNEDRGFGSVRPDLGGGPIYCHVRSIVNSGMDPGTRIALRVGTRVSFVISFNAARCKYLASNVTILDPSGLYVVGGHNGDSFENNTTHSEASEASVQSASTSQHVSASSTISPAVSAHGAGPDSERTADHVRDELDPSLAVLAAQKNFRMCIAGGVGCRCDKCTQNMSWRHRVISEFAASSGGRQVFQQDAWENADIIWKAQFDPKVLNQPTLKAFTGVKNHGLVTDKAALVRQGLRLMGRDFFDAAAPYTFILQFNPRDRSPNDVLATCKAHLDFFNNRGRGRVSSSRAACNGNALWIIKPAGLWGGKRIEMEHASDLPAWVAEKHSEITNARGRPDRFGRTWVLQKYVEAPLTVERKTDDDDTAAAAESNSGGGVQPNADGVVVPTATKAAAAASRHKVDFRLFVFVSKEGVFCARQYLGRVSPMPFTDLTQRRRPSKHSTRTEQGPDRKEDVKAHLTNTSIHKVMDEFTMRMGPDDPEVGPLAGRLYAFLRKLAPVFMSTFEELPPRDNGSRPPIWSFQVFGVDVLLDRDLNPTLLEINTNPGFVGRAGDSQIGHFEGLFARLTRVMCRFMWTSVIREPPEELIVLHDNTTRGGTAPAFAPLAPSITKGGDVVVSVELEPLGVEHYEDLFHVVDDSAVMRTVQKGATLSIAELVRRCSESANDWASKSRLYHHWAIVVDGHALGMLLWHRRSEQQNFQLRILVSPRAQGRGVATRALRRSLELLSEMYPRGSPGAAECAEADVHHGNAASARLMRRCGFRPNGQGSYGRVQVDKFVFDMPL